MDPLSGWRARGAKTEGALQRLSRTGSTRGRFGARRVDRPRGGTRASDGSLRARRLRAPLCFECYRAEAARERALKASGEIDTASEAGSSRSCHSSRSTALDSSASSRADHRHARRTTQGRAALSTNAAAPRSPRDMRWSKSRLSLRVRNGHRLDRDATAGRSRSGRSPCSGRCSIRIGRHHAARLRFRRGFASGTPLIAGVRTAVPGRMDCTFAHRALENDPVRAILFVGQHRAHIPHPRALVVSVLCGLSGETIRCLGASGH